MSDKYPVNPLFGKHKDIISYYEEQYRLSVEEYGEDSLIAKTYKREIEQRKRGVHKMTLAELFSKRPLS